MGSLGFVREIADGIYVPEAPITIPKIGSRESTYMKGEYPNHFLWRITTARVGAGISL